MKQKTLATTALLLILAPGVARADDFDRSLKLVEAGDYVGGQKILKKLIKLQPERAEVWFNLGYTLYKEKNFEAAIEAWETVIKMKSPLAQTAELYIVQALIDSNQQQDAIEAHSLIYRKSLDPSLQEEYDGQQVRLASYNPIFAQSSTTQLPSTSWSSLVSAAYGSRSASGYGTETLPMASGYIEYQSPQKLGGLYQFHWDDFIGTDRLFTQTAEAKAQYTPAWFDSGRTQFTISPGVSYVLLNSTPFSLDPLINLEATRKFGKVWTGSILTASRSLVSDPSYTYLTGNSLMEKLYAYVPVNKVWIGGALYGGSQATGGLPISGNQLPYSNRTLGGELDLTVPLPKKFSVSASTAYFHRWFDQSDPSSATPTDGTISSTLTFSYQIDRALSANLSQTALWNHASASPIFTTTQYTEYRTLVGLSWAPLGAI